MQVANTDDGSCTYCYAVADIGADTIVPLVIVHSLVLIQLLMVLIVGRVICLIMV